ncbi:winged helix-turn-helix transcriptional regulator [Neogemmobacter tilapiae]|uniref:HTH hxlR-type domain-containing protein n=1 Tax=Neogemmobacter tilapiae TaxID=875041 RepID=A0A918WJ29_9RHOB|nr:helix-turn-helix domain-containing protein [Gemmobacter tilapiae]GHC47868.1 hypothetical protein GCM10007315_07210 [Gemmobacter tilapiae]
MTSPRPDEKLLHCPALVATRVIAGKWKTRVLWLLRERPHHFGELKGRLPGVSAKVLAEQLQQLERDGLIQGQAELRGGVSFVLYDYTRYGRTLIPALDALGTWGLEHAAWETGR